MSYSNRPEGDFSKEEVDMAVKAGYKAVSLGEAAYVLKQRGGGLSYYSINESVKLEAGSGK